MRIIINNVPDLEEDEQQELGRKLLLVMFYEGIKINGIRVEFYGGEITNGKETKA